jgi:SAM-dependent methyltransferase
MPQTPFGADGGTPTVPSMLDLVRLSPRLLFPPGGADLYRHIALLTEMKEGDEVLVVACGKGVTLEYFVRETGVHGSGVDADPRLITVAEERARQDGLTGVLQFQTGRSDSLPYRDEIFDVAVGELGLAAHADPAEAVRELVRVTKPGGSVVLVQLSWKAPVDEARRRILSEHLGARPLMAVEWKRLLKSAGVGDLFTSDWSDEERVGPGAKPFFDFAEVFTLSEKADILRRAWRRWGLRGVRTVLAREGEVHKLLNRERLLRLDLLKGRKLPTAEAGEPTPERQDAAHAEAPEKASEGDAPHESPDTAGLPLFQDGRGDRDGR